MNMRALFRKYIAVGLLFLLLLSCNRRDLNILDDIADDHTGRLERLEQIIIEGQRMLSAIHTLLLEYDKRQLITGTENLEGGGYVVRFSDGDSAVINDAVSPVVEVSGHNTWVINGVDSGVKVVGDDGADAVAPQVRRNGGYWEISKDGGNTWEPTNVPLKGDTGEDGDALPVWIGENGNWFIGETDTGNKAIGSDGKVVADAPKVEARANGDGSYNWWIKNGTNSWKDTGVLAIGKDGEDGADGTYAPYINSVKVSGSEISFVFSKNIPGTNPATNVITVQRKPPFDCQLQINGVWVSQPEKSIAVTINTYAVYNFKLTQNSGSRFDLAEVVAPEGFGVTADPAAGTIKIAPKASINRYVSGNVILRFTNEARESFAYRFPVETQIYQIDVSNFEFTDSYVYHVNDVLGKKVAEICQEYITRPGGGVKAVVVYLFDGDTDTYGKGYVMGYGGTVDHATAVYNPGGEWPAGRNDFNLLTGTIIPSLDQEIKQVTPLGAASRVADVADDFDGNKYKVVKTGASYWLAENLRTGHYNTGEAIAKVESNALWPGGSDAKYCYYNNDPVAYKTIYGALYNRFAVQADKLAPAGWHVATDEEWKTMEIYLGMAANDADRQGERGNDQGRKLKQADVWQDNTANGNNIAGFCGLPGGRRVGVSGAFGDRLQKGNWWTATAGGGGLWIRTLANDKITVNRSVGNNSDGYSVRCVRNRNSK